MASERKDIRGLGAIDVVEAAYRLDGTEVEWLQALLARARADLDTGCGVYAFTGNDAVPNFPACPAFAQNDLDPGFAERLAELNRNADPAVIDLLKSRAVMCGALDQTVGSESPIVAAFRLTLKPTGVRFPAHPPCSSTTPRSRNRSRAGG